MSSSPIVSPHARSGRTGELLELLSRVPDPRDPRGVRYPLAGMLAVGVSAVLAGARSFTAIGEWAGEVLGEDLDRLGLATAPQESTLRKLFARIDADALDRQVGAFLWARTRHFEGRTVIAIDGKTIRGARSGDRAAPHLVAALEHTAGVVLGQIAVAAKSNEIPAVRDLLAGFDPADLQGSVITVDAMHTQTDTAQVITDAGADYLFTIKGNQARLHSACKKLPWKDVPAHRVTSTGHGRRVTRTIKVIDAPSWIQFPNAAQLAQVRRTVTKNGRKSIEVVYLLTSADHTGAPPAALAAWVQGHWAIENKLHWCRDVTFDEDRSQVRAGNAPQVMATVRNAAISLLRLTGWTNIAAGLRHHSRDPARTITYLLTC